MTIWHDILIDPNDNLEHNNQPSYGKENMGGIHFNKNNIHGLSWAIVHNIQHSLTMAMWEAMSAEEIKHHR